MNCSEFKDLLHEYFTDPSMDEELQESIEMHTLECARCAKLYLIHQKLEEPKFKQKLKSGRVDHLVKKAEEYIENEQYDDAIECLEEALSLEPDDAECLRLMGLVLILQKKYSQAREFLDKAIAIDPDDLWAYMHLGRAYFEEDMISEAEFNLKKVLEFDPDHLHANLYLGHLFDRGLMPWSAKPYYKKVIEINPEFPKIQYLYGKTCYLQKEYEEAIPHLEKAVESDPDNFMAFMNLGNCYVELKDYNKAEIAYLRCTENIPQDIPQLFGALGYVYLEIGKYAQAKEYLTKAEIMAPEEPSIHNNLACCYWQRNDKSTAQHYIKVARDLNPDNENVQYNYRVFMGLEEGEPIFLHVPPLTYF